MADTPGNTSTTASLTVGGTVNDTLEALGDHDWFRITLTAGQSITVFVDGLTLEDSYVRIRNASGTLLAENDDIVLGVNRDSQVSFTAPTSGIYYIDVGAFDESYTGTYQVSVTNYTPPPVYTNDQIADQLVNGYWGGDSHHFNVGPGGSITVNITALTSAGQTLARAALQEWTDIIGVNFIEVTSGGQITFDDNQSGAATDSDWFGGLITSSHVNVSTQWLNNYGTALNTYSFQTYIHEIGHALGLGHAGNYNGTANFPTDANHVNDAWSTSVMSYFSQTENSYFSAQGFTDEFVLTPMVADIIAMSQLYGLSATTRADNTIYGFNSNAGNAVFDAVQNPDVAYAIYDSGGTDTLDYSGFGTGQVINLNPETFSNVGAGIGNVTIARGVVIENAIGGSGNDTLIGNSAANVLTGNGGADTLEGGVGADTLIGELGNDRFIVDQSGDVITELAGQGEDMVIARASYALGTGVSVEVMTTVNASATTVINLTGNELGQSLYGNAGNNILMGNGGADYLAGGAGNDVYYVDITDTITEAVGGGDDMVVVPVSYTLAGGTEIETLVAWNQDSTDPVNLTGNEFGQSLYGSQGVNSLNGGAGNDFLVGLGGNDFLLGGAGNDNMQGGQGNDVYYVQDTGDQIFEADGEGDDIAVAFASFTLGAGQSVETLSANATSGAINLGGNELAQSLYGNGSANLLSSGGGADYLIGGGGNDTFVLTNAPGVPTIGDYTAGDVVDISQYLSVAGGTDVIAGGFVKIVGTQLQVDANGGGDGFVTVGNVSGSGAVAIRYLSGGSAANTNVSRSASQDVESKGQSTMTVMAVAAAGMAALVPTGGDGSSDGGAALASVGNDLDFAMHSQAFAPLAFDGHPAQSSGLMALASSITAHMPVETNLAHASPWGAVPASFDTAQAATPTELLQATAAPAQAAIVSQVPLAAPAVTMPSATMLAAADSAAQHDQVLGKALADALAGGESHDAIGQALASLAAPPGAPVIEPLTALTDAAAGFHFAQAAPHAFAMDMLAAHVDAPPAA